jgi:hypothetical protein
VVFIDGLLFGLWLLGVILPSLLGLTLTGYVLWLIYTKWFREEEYTAADFMEDFPPELPTNDDVVPEHRFIASTIVRPPNVVSREDVEKDDDDEKS